ncbi:hypothetical protein ElyMa_002831700 [Elysia marginata]|uniref:Uncharacterized protein n=1 Tax=Elysia marginata TaxID=1093978 RepID=A0AAV4HTX5_9GAST|nr:hypothetical protein ElyMa_002831700 [Elysia marginata]
MKNCVMLFCLALLLSGCVVVQINAQCGNNLLPLLMAAAAQRRAGIQAPAPQPQIPLNGAGVLGNGVVGGGAIPGK